jgi:autotransporter-associated beta strand protein
MAGDSWIRRFWRATVAFLLAVIWSAGVARAQYTFVRDIDTSDTWDNTARWLDGGTNTTYPNAADATVSIAAPTTTAVLSGPQPGYRLDIPNDVTVGHITVDNTGYGNTYRTYFGNNAGHLKFQSTSGPATYTETFGSNSGTTSSQYQFNTTVELLSDLVITQDNYPGFNSGTIFKNLVSGAANITLTKTGQGGIQFEYNNPLPGVEIPFQGQVVINQGDIRPLTPVTFSNASGITVNSGGQLKLADNAPNPNNSNWSLAPGAVLNLNGSGKASGNNPDGALRFALSQVASTSFDSPVVLQSDSVISVTPNGGSIFTTGTISSVVSGPSGLTKHGPGTLVLSNASNSYSGDTRILAGGGTLTIANPFLSDTADVYLNPNTTFNLIFSATDTIRSLYIDGTPQPVGLYGRVGSADPNDTELALITGDGYLNVTTLGAVGVPGDYNNNGVVDTADYVLWRNGGPLQNEVNAPGTVNEQDYVEWRARFGNPNTAAGSALDQRVVPEPASIGAAAIALLLVTACRSRSDHGARSSRHAAV